MGIDTKHKTPFKIDAFNMDKLVSLGSKYSSDFKDDEEYKSLAKGIEEKKEKNKMSVSKALNELLRSIL